MAGGESDGPGFPTSGLIAALVLVAGAIVVQQVPYVASRPPLTETARRPFVAGQDVEARLWQDPFATITRHIEQGPSRASDGTELDPTFEAYRHSTGLMRSLVTPEPSNTVVMPVMVPGGPYGEDIEGRRRTRHAVVTALNQLGFDPEDPEHLGYVRPWPETDGVDLPRIVPWERFSKSSRESMSSASVVLVLWVDSSAFKRPEMGGPLVKLGRLLEALVLCPIEGNLAERPHVAIIGPADSDGILAMRQATGGSDYATPVTGACLAGAAIYSPWATAAGSFTSGVPTTGDRPVSVGGSPLPLAGIQFFPMVAADASLMRVLRNELGLRGVGPARGKNAVAVVSELDTEYGRALADTVRNGLCAGLSTTAGKRCGGNVHAFHYLRGLDGETAGRVTPKNLTMGQSSDDRKRADTPAEKPRRIEDLERAEGDSQFDALRRLAGLIRREHDRLVAEGRPGFRSVGVFGNDFYDKLLVLQAIRREFPTAIFFTTDLDARYLHPREFQWTRNLIVASSYGLELREELQAGVVPFRNNYETATFLATTVAVINAAPKDGKGISAETIRHWIRLDASRIYEVGRTELIDLTEWPRDRREGACRPLNDDCKNVHPVPTFVHRGRALGGWTVVALLGFVLAPLISSNVRRGGTAAARWCGDHLIVTFGIALAGAVAGVGVAMALAWEGNDSEPFRFFEGVSIWPSEIIRGLALAVAIIGIVMTDIRRRRTERTLGARYFGETPGRTVGPSVTELWDEAKRASGRLYAALAPSATPLPVPAVEEVSAWRRIFAGKPGRPYFLARSYIDVEEMWKEHCYQNASVARWTRVVVGTIIFFVFSATLILTVGAPNVPARGPVAPAVDTVVILVTVAALILLVFDIGDAIKLCDKFAYYLGSPIKNRWPSYTRREFGVQASDPGSALDTWIDVRFIAEWTGRIGGIIYYPFVVLLLMIVARSSIFDNWDMPPGLIVVFILSFVVAAASVFILRHAAERLRRVAVERLLIELVTGDGNAPDAPSTKQLRTVLAEVRDLKQGAFAPITHQPLVRAALLPLSGAGGIALIEYFFLR